MAKKGTDCKEVAEAVKEKNDGSRDVELIWTENGEFVAVPKSQADQTKGIKAGEIAKKDFHLQ